MKKTMQDYIDISHKACLENIENINKLSRELLDEFIERNPKKLWIVASGSSYNGSVCALPFLKKYLGIEVKITTPYSFYSYEYREVKKEDMIFVISQTGYSTNAIEALKKVGEIGKTKIGITGDLNSDFKTYSDLIVDYGSGIETVHYVTIGVTTNVVFLMMFSLLVAKNKEYISIDEYNKIVDDIKKALLLHPEVIKNTHDFVDNHYKDLLGTEVLYICGVGSNYGTAIEGALKFGETVHIPTIAVELEEYIHGHNLQLSQKYTVFIFGNGDHTNERAESIYNGVKEVTNKAYFITSGSVNKDFNTLLLPNTDELLNPIIFLPVIQTITSRVSSILDRQVNPLLEKMEEKVKSKSENYKG